ncbi:MAG: polysaccharide pyruvyl transferase family protein [Pseudoalteromonas sp.]
MIIEIKNVQFVNKGAELMLRAILQQLNIHFPDAEICLAHNANSPHNKRVAIGAYKKVNLRKNIIDFNRFFYFVPAFIRRYLKSRFGIVFEVDVDVVLDASGFGYGDQWSDLIMQQVACEVSRVQRLGKKYIFMPQSLGPFTREKNKKYAQKAFSNASLVFAREKPSYDHITCLIENHNNLFKAPDFTNLLEADTHIDYTHFKDSIIVIPNSKMLSNKNKDIWWRDNYISVIVSLIEQSFKVGEKVIILNHSGADDALICAKIKEQLSRPCEIVEPSDAIMVKSLIGVGKLVISSRFHGCVSAFSQGVPCIGTGWSHKYLELFSEYESTSKLLRTHIDKSELEAIIVDSIENNQMIRLKQKSCVLKYKLQTESMWKKVFSVISSKELK